jgi:hypothetical protein
MAIHGTPSFFCCARKGYTIGFAQWWWVVQLLRLLHGIAFRTAKHDKYTKLRCWLDDGESESRKKK